MMFDFFHLSILQLMILLVISSVRCSLNFRNIYHNFMKKKKKARFQVVLVNFLEQLI